MEKMWANIIKFMHSAPPSPLPCVSSLYSLEIPEMSNLLALHGQKNEWTVRDDALSQGCIAAPPPPPPPLRWSSDTYFLVLVAWRRRRCCCCSFARNEIKWSSYPFVAHSFPTCIASPRRSHCIAVIKGI